MVRYQELPTEIRELILFFALYHHPRELCPDSSPKDAGDHDEESPTRNYELRIYEPTVTQHVGCDQDDLPVDTALFLSFTSKRVRADLSAAITMHLSDRAAEIRATVGFEKEEESFATMDTFLNMPQHEFRTGPHYGYQHIGNEVFYLKKIRSIIEGKANAQADRDLAIDRVTKDYVESLESAIEFDMFGHRTFAKIYQTLPARLRYNKTLAWNIRRSDRLHRSDRGPRFGLPPEGILGKRGPKQMRYIHYKGPRASQGNPPFERKCVAWMYPSFPGSSYFKVYKSSIARKILVSSEDRWGKVDWPGLSVNDFL